MIPAGFIVVRSPLLPFEELARLGDGCQGAAAGEAAIAADGDRIVRELLSIFERPALKDALYIASRSLSERTRKLAAAPNADPSIAARLMSYFARLCTRPTPFGLFSGISLGETGASTTWRIAPPSDYRRRTRIDNELLFALAAHLEADDEVRRLVRYLPNPTLAPVGDRLRVVQRRKQNCVAIAVEPSRELDLVLARAAAGATLAELTRALYDDGCDEADAAAFVEDLRTSQILVCELQPSTTGEEPFVTLMRTLEARGIAGPLERLREIEGEIAAIDRAGPGAPPARYDEVEGALSRMFSEPPDLKSKLQIELLKPSPHLSLSAGVAAEIGKAAEIYLRFAAPVDGLKEFRQRFAQRFDQREVPLPLALDEDLGVALGAVPPAMSPFLAEVPFEARETRKKARENSPLHALLARKLHDALRRGATTISLAPADLASLEPAKLPPSFGVMGYLLASSDEAIRTGDYKVRLQSVWGPSAAKLLGRFGHASPELTEALRKLVREEQDGHEEALLAEVAHLPGSRIANVTARPHLRAHGIRYFDGPTTEAACQLPIDDVLVSVVGDEVVLRSKRLGRRLLPRLTHAHVADHGTNIPIYRFLRMVEDQGRTMGSFQWGNLSDMPFLPRVELGRMILSYARWRIPSSDLEPHDALRARRLCEELGMPRFVSLSEPDGDMGMIVDLHNPISVHSLFEAATKQDWVDVYEYGPAQGRLCLSDGEHAYTHEFIIPFHREPRVTMGPQAAPNPAPAVTMGPRAAPNPAPAQTLPRALLPGDPEWSYFRVYTGTGTSDRVLFELADRVVSPLLEGGFASAWFFVRYADPEEHLRLRLRLRRPEHAGVVLERMRSVTADLLDRGLVWRMDMGTYERELERYGGAACMPIVEEMFCADSAAVLAILRRISGDDLADLRWMAALGVAGAYVRAAGLEGEARVAFATRLATNMGHEYRASLGLKRKLGSMYRERAQTFGALLSDEPWGADPRLAACAPAFRALSESLAGCFARVTAVAPAGILPDLLGSLIHMHVNRMLRAEGSKHEMVFHDMMRRVYASALHGHAPGRAKDR